MDTNQTAILLRVEEVARRLAISRTHAYELVLSGALPSIKIGRSRRVPSDELDKYVERRLASPNG